MVYKKYEVPLEEGEEKEEEKPEKVEGEGDDARSMSDENEDEAIEQIPLEEGVLTINIGIPLVIILNKSEVTVHGEQASYFKSRFDFIMRHIRKFALMFGGAIFSTSALKQTGLSSFYSYLNHRFYGFDFNEKPEPRDKEAIIIPTGYDKPSLIAQLSPDQTDPYEKIVNKPDQVMKESVDYKEIKCDDIESFLNKLKDVHFVKTKRPAPPKTTTAAGSNDKLKNILGIVGGAKKDEKKTSSNLAELLKKKKDGGAPDKSKTKFLDLLKKKDDKY